MTHARLSNVSTISKAIAASKGRTGEPVFFPYVGTTFNTWGKGILQSLFMGNGLWHKRITIKEKQQQLHNPEGYSLLMRGKTKHIINYSKCILLLNRSPITIIETNLLQWLQGYCRNPRAASARSGCKAAIQLRRTDNHSWIVSAVNPDHNHPMSVSCAEKKQRGSHSLIDPMTRIHKKIKTQQCYFRSCMQHCRCVVSW